MVGVNPGGVVQVLYFFSASPWYKLNSLNEKSVHPNDLPSFLYIHVQLNTKLYSSISYQPSNRIWYMY